MTNPHPSDDDIDLEPDDESADDGSSDTSGRRLLLRTGASVLILFLLVGLGAFFFKDDLQAAGEWFVAQFGIFGVFVGIFASDSIGVPIPPDTYLVAAVTGKADPVPMLIAACISSVVAGNLAYVIGKYLGDSRIFRRLMARYKDKGQALIEKWGVWAVAIAAWTPVPFSVICWIAGAFHMPYKRFFLATLTRVPRHVVYYLVIVAGWNVGG